MRKVAAPEFVGLDAKGLEHPDPRPVELPTRLRIPQRQVDRVRHIIRQELSDEARSRGVETFQESDDFVMDDVEPFSPYEEVFEPNPELTKRRKSDKVGRRRNDAADKEKDHGRSKARVDGEGAGDGDRRVGGADEVGSKSAGRGKESADRSGVRGSGGADRGSESEAADR